VIVSVDGKPVRRLADLNDALEETGIGKSVKLGLMRDGQRETIDVAVADIGQPRLGEAPRR
jgi:S1-C subfamily serine protease